MALQSILIDRLDLSSHKSMIQTRQTCHDLLPDLFEMHLLLFDRSFLQDLFGMVTLLVAK